MSDTFQTPWQARLRGVLNLDATDPESARRYAEELPLCRCQRQRRRAEGLGRFVGRNAPVRHARRNGLAAKCPRDLCRRADGRNSSEKFWLLKHYLDYIHRFCDASTGNRNPSKAAKRPSRGEPLNRHVSGSVLNTPIVEAITTESNRMSQATLNAPRSKSPAVAAFMEKLIAKNPRRTRIPPGRLRSGRIGHARRRSHAGLSPGQDPRTDRRAGTGDHVPRRLGRRSRARSRSTAATASR